MSWRLTKTKDVQEFASDAGYLDSDFQRCFIDGRLSFPLGKYLLPLKEGCADAEHDNVKYGDYACYD
jgi:hypothetical protein